MNNEELLQQTMNNPQNIVDYEDKKSNNILFAVALLAMCGALGFVVSAKFLPMIFKSNSLSGQWICTQSDNINLVLTFKDDYVDLDMNTYGIKMIMGGKYTSNSFKFSDDNKYEGVKNYTFYSLDVNVDKYIVSNKEQTYSGDANVIFGSKGNQGQVIVGNKPYNCTRK